MVIFYLEGIPPFLPFRKKTPSERKTLQKEKPFRKKKPSERKNLPSSQKEGIRKMAFLKKRKKKLCIFLNAVFFKQNQN